MARENDRLVLLLDKPAGMSSFQATDQAREILKAEKAGHTGTLDENVTGLLVIGLGESRKAMPVLVGQDKEYEGSMQLHQEMSKEEIEKAFKKFTGKITQKPPVKSRAKREERERLIHNLSLLGLKNKAIKFKVLCEKGTYIRKLCHDIGESLGPGAHMTGLRRTQVGPFKLEEAVTLESLDKGEMKGIITLEEALERSGTQKIEVYPAFEEKVRNGLPIQMAWLKESAPQGFRAHALGIHSQGRIIALGKPDKSQETVKVTRVFLDWPKLERPRKGA